MFLVVPHLYSAGVLAEAFMAKLVLQAPGVQNVEPQVLDVVFEDELLGDSEDEEDDLFDLFWVSALDCQ